MSNYVKATNFFTKDALLTGNPDKIIKGSEIDAEYNAIATAISSKADTTSPTLTGTPLAPTATAGSNTTQIATTAFVKGATDALGDMSLQNKTAVDITGGTIAGVTVAGTFTGNITGNVTGNVTGTVSGNAGTVTNGVYTTNFTGTNQSLASANGYQKLPGGLIMQWGSVSITGYSTNAVTYPTAFTTVTRSIQFTIQGGSLGNTEGALAANTISTTGFSITSSMSGSFPVFWLAIGY